MIFAFVLCGGARCWSFVDAGQFRRDGYERDRELAAALALK